MLTFNAKCSFSMLTFNAQFQSPLSTSLAHFQLHFHLHFQGFTFNGHFYSAYLISKPTFNAYFQSPLSMLTFNAHFQCSSLSMRTFIAHFHEDLRTSLLNFTHSISSSPLRMDRSILYHVVAAVFHSYALAYPYYYKLHMPSRETYGGRLKFLTVWAHFIQVVVDLVVWLCMYQSKLWSRFGLL